MALCILLASPSSTFWLLLVLEEKLLIPVPLARGPDWLLHFANLRSPCGICLRHCPFMSVIREPWGGRCVPRRCHPWPPASPSAGEVGRKPALWKVLE